jgi:hypothetical protein
MRVGEFYERNRNLRLVEIWVADQHITCDDSWAYLPTFCGDLDYSISMLLQDHYQSLPWPDLSPAQTHNRLHEMDDGTAERFWALNWGPTTDNVYALLFRQGQNVILTFEFWRPSHHNPADLGKVFTVELPERELLRVLHMTSVFLRSDRSNVLPSGAGSL